MTSRRALLATSLLALAGAACGKPAAAERFELTLSDAQWRKRLTAAQYRTLRQEATDPAGQSPFNHLFRRGTYACAGCGLPAYSSGTKFDSGTGWPSFWAPLPGSVRTRVDRTLGFARTEVHCRRCGGHHGHVFDDGPRPTGQRYCINGTALAFRAA